MGILYSKGRRREAVGGGLTLEDRVPTGIDGLDCPIKGGSPKGSLVLLAGDPGTRAEFSVNLIWQNTTT